METTREEHLLWCKNRAMEYAERGDFTQAVASMCSDLGKHEETRGHSGIQLGTMGLMAGLYNSRDSVSRWIMGFN